VALEEYKRYDTFYVENHTFGLDAAIMLATVASVIGRGLRLCVRLPARRASSGDITSALIE